MINSSLKRSSGNFNVCVIVKSGFTLVFINATQPESCAIVDGATIELSLLWEYQKERRAKMEFGLMQYSNTILFLIVILLVIIYPFYLIIKALRKYTKSEPVRKQEAANAKNLGEVLKQHRVACKMTQEFVAETIGVSRQAVSKWESGKSDPSTTNLLALAKLFGVEAEELLKDLHY